MTQRRKSQLEVLVEKLDRELVARSVQAPLENWFEFEDKEGTPERENIIRQVKEVYASPAFHSTNNALSHITTYDLTRMLRVKIRELNTKRGIWEEDNRVDYYSIPNEQIKKNADCAAAICINNNLIEEKNKNGFSTLKVKNYRKAFNLCSCEPFHDQPIAAGRLYTGFLVKDDVIATAGHCADEQNVKELRFIFGYRMLAPFRPVTQVPDRNIYKGTEIIGRVYNPGNGSDWALVKLDRKVVGQQIAKLTRGEISPGKQVYIIGHPVGLPLKYSPGATVSNISETCFSADLNVYCGSSGSPVFDSETHSVIGIVVRGDNRDFRLVENCWMSVIYSRSDKNPKEPQCTRVSEFIKYL